MKNFKRFMAVAMAATMLVGSVTVMADETTVGGVGSVEGIIVKDVFSVDVPTATEAQDTFDFVLDPQKLITETSEAGKGTSDKYADGETVFFTNKGSGEAADTYSNVSDSIKVYNTGTVAVDVSVEATMTIAEDAGVTLTDDAAFTEDNTTSIYMALVGDAIGGSAPTTVAIDAEDGASLSAQIAVTADAYEVTYTDSDYKYTLKSAFAGDANVTKFKGYEFKMTGDCNTNELVDWSGLSEDFAPTVSIVWNVTKYEANVAPTFASNEIGVITYDAGRGNLAMDTDSITKIILTDDNDPNTSFDVLNAYESFWGDATEEAGKITFDPQCLVYYPSNTAKAVVYYTVGGEEVTSDPITVTIRTAQ